MPYSDNRDEHFLIVNRINYPIVTYSETPEVNALKFLYTMWSGVICKGINCPCDAFIIPD